MRGIELTVRCLDYIFSRTSQPNCPHKSAICTDYARYYAQLEEKRLQEEEGANEASDGGFSSSNRDDTSKKRPREDEDEGATQIEAPQKDDQGKSGVIVYGMW